MSMRYIFMKHWQAFNNELNNRKIKSEKNWQKFGITTKQNGRYFCTNSILKHQTE